MKKVLSIALVLAMLLAMMVPMTVAADDTATTGHSTVADLIFYEEYNASSTQAPASVSNTGFDAFKGTPTIDGSYATGEAWDNAVPLVLNSTTKTKINNLAWENQSPDLQAYLLWDENNLYYLEIDNNFEWSGLDGKTFKTDATMWGGYKGSMLTIVKNGDLGEGTTSMPGYQIGLYPLAKDGTANTSLVVGTAYQGASNLRTRAFAYDSSAKKVSGGGGSWSNKTDTIETYFTKTGDKGLVLEAKIPLSAIGYTGTASATSDPFIGFAIYKYGKNAMSGVTRRNGVTIEGDAAGGFDPIALLETKDQAEGGTNREIVNDNYVAITPDVDFFVADGTGVLRTAGEATIEIDSAEKLLGLSYAMENYSYDANTKGKTFVITKDIDLNPHVTDWTDYGKMYWETPNKNKWLSLDEFYGNIDGQGHTIRGFYSPNAAHGSSSATADWGLFGGRKPDGYVKNIIIDDGYICDNDGGGFGTIWGVAYNRQSGDINVAIENVYIGKNFTIVANKQATGCQVGPVTCGYWSNVAGTSFTGTFTNVVFAGNMIVTKSNGADVGNFFGSWREGSVGNSGATTKFSSVITDVVVAKINTEGSVAETMVGKNGATRVSYAPKGLPAKNADVWTQTTMGIMPNQVADMLAEYAWQSTQAVDGKYNVRIIGEAFDMDFETMGFKVRLIKNGTEYAEFNNADNKTVYMSVMAANETKTAADMNVGLYDGENGMYVLTLNGLDADATYTVEVVSVWTLEDGTTVESVVAKTATVSAYVPSAS